MNTIRFSLLVFIALLLLACSQRLRVPIEINNYQRLTSAKEIEDFVKTATKVSDRLDYTFFGESVEGRKLLVVKKEASNPKDALRVLVFAQQHGNEPSGKEAALLLINQLAGNQLSSYDNLEIWIVPQLNPDGAEEGKRRNANGIDLNRDHVVINSPETRAVRSLFWELMPHVTLDIHEYYPYNKSWEEFGGFKNFDVQVGVPTNYNVSPKIKKFALQSVLPAIEKQLLENGYTFFNYIVGPAPHLGRTRHSTVDIDDGRQSFAILNTLSFIFEGINGRENLDENIERRAKSQLEALNGLLNHLNDNAEKVVQLVDGERNELENGASSKKVAIRMEHFSNGVPLQLPLKSAITGNDTIVIVENFHPMVKPLMEVTRPKGYLVPKNDSLLINFMLKHKVKFDEYNIVKGDVIFSYQIGSIETREDEELENRLPEVSTKTLANTMLQGMYYFVSTSQLHSNFLVTLFEPQSMNGLAQREGYQYLLQPNSTFPILRVE